MTDRSTHSNTPDNGAPDALVALYRSANAQDSSATGPSDTARDRVLAYACAQAAQRAATAAPAATFSGKPANEHRWLRQALGSMAALGLVGLLTLHHLDEPNAPQLDSPASSANVPAPAPASAESAPITADSASAPTKYEEKVAPAQAGSALPAIKSGVIERERAAAQTRKAPQRNASDNKMQQAEIAADTSAMAKAQSPHPLPDCDEHMPPEAQAAQIRRIQAQDKAKATGQPLPEPVPVCKPLPPKPTTPEAPPVDSP